MKFNDIIDSILKQPINEKIKPFLSGDVERYITYIISISSTPEGPYRCGDVVDDQDDMFAQWNILKTCYIGNDFLQAFDAYIKAMKTLNVSPYVIDDAKHQAWRFSELNNIATFKVCTLPCAVYIKVVIDNSLARSSEIHKNIKNIDTTGLEDLL